MIVDGRALAQTVLARTKERVAGRAPRVLALVANDSPATNSYLIIKERRALDAGCVLETKRFADSVTTAELIAAIHESTADAIIVQLPLPAHVNAREVCDAIPLSKDADVLSSAGRAAFEKGEGLLPPVVGAVKEIQDSNGVEVRGKRAVVIGAGFLVGAPVATWLTQEGAEVSLVTRESGDLAAHLLTADIIVSGAGSAHLITPDMIKDGVVLIDAGTSESNGEVAGDADPSCAPKCSLFTPVPRGVGPVAVAKLFENSAILATNQ